MFINYSSVVETTCFQVIFFASHCWSRHLHLGVSAGVHPTGMGYSTNGESQCLQIFLHQREGNGAFADGRGNPMVGAEAYIAGRENPGNAGLQ